MPAFRAGGGMAAWPVRQPAAAGRAASARADRGDRVVRGEPSGRAALRAPVDWAERVAPWPPAVRLAQLGTE
jgi:hypothetical protein